MCVWVLSCFSHVQLFASLWTVACQVPLSMASSRQEYWSRVAIASSGDLLDSGIKLASPEAPSLQVDSLLLNHQGSSYEYVGNKILKLS